jgi:type I restriction enzyme, S subunit
MPNDWPIVRLDDLFTIQQGKQVSARHRPGDRQRPFLRTKNVYWGRLELADLDAMHFSEEDERRLRLVSGDLLTCEGGWVGRTAIWNGEKTVCLYQNHLHRLRRISTETVPQFALYWLWYAFEIGEVYFGRQNVTTIPNLSKSRLGELQMPSPKPEEQLQIGKVLSAVQRAIERQGQLIAITAELKKALTHKLFTEGTRGEPLKQTEIGLLPDSWEPTPLGSCCDIVSSSMSYSDFERQAESTDDDGVPCMAVKVSDMNLAGNEASFVTANAIKRLPAGIAKKKLVPPHTVVFPKRGAAIATNKKRLTTTCTALDPNLIGVRAKEEIDPQFLFYWSQTFDLRKITDPGPTPQLNKKDLTPVRLPLPPSLDEQRLVTRALDAVVAKLTLHRQNQSSLTRLFRTLLHQLMTAQVRVHDLDLSALEAAQEAAEAEGVA